jgi:cyclohexadieny/prephenate dehydrogenase
MQFDIITIVGAGLIGGSLGLAAKQRRLARTVRGIGRKQASLERARAVGAIDEGFLEPGPALKGAGLVIFCTPVDRIADQILEYSACYSPGTLLTDAGSTKESIVAAVEGRLPAGIEFVGSHPLAGSEKRGPYFADANLFHGRLAVVTQTPRTDQAALSKTVAFWQAVGSRVKIMVPADHDHALAMTSHLPHLVAAALAGILPPDVFELTATGFRDTTRVAAGDPNLWSAIFAHNTGALLEALRPFSGRLSQFQAALEAGEWSTVESLLTQAKKVRDALGN